MPQRFIVKFVIVRHKCNYVELLVFHPIYFSSFSNPTSMLLLTILYNVMLLLVTSVKITVHISLLPLLQPIRAKEFLKKLTTFWKSVIKCKTRQCQSNMNEGSVPVCMRVSFQRASWVDRSDFSSLWTVLSFTSTV